MQVSVLLHHFTYCRTEHILPLFKDLLTHLLVYFCTYYREGNRERKRGGERSMCKTNIDAYVPPHDHDGPQLSLLVAF